MIVGVVNESYPNERRVALVPGAVEQLAKFDCTVCIEAGAGESAGFTNEQYEQAGAKILSDRAAVFAEADAIAQVRTLGANLEAGRSDLDLIREGQAIIGHAEPLTAVEPTQAIAERGARLFAMELMPRITRAQSMDALSSQATIQGYKAVVLAAEALPRMFPMMMTAAGTVAAAHVFVIGAGVAGLQAIATSKRLGAIVRGYDIRPVVKEQVESLGGQFVELELESGEGEGGYAREMDEEFYRKQRELMGSVVAESDVVICTAAIPGRKAPVLVTAEHVRSMRPGSIIVDLAAERGGNCELSKPDETVMEGDVRILGPTNLPATVPYHASQMYARNIVTFLKHLVEDGNIKLDMQDEITVDTLLTDGGKIIHNRICEQFGLEPPARAVAATAEAAGAESEGSEG